MQRWSFMVQTGRWQGWHGTRGFGLNRRRKAIERRPVIGAGGAENAHGRRAERGRDMHQAGIVGNRDAGRRHRQNAVAQVGAGEVADPRAAGGHDLRRQRLFAGAADHPDVQAAVRPEAARPPDNRSSAWTSRPSPAPAPRLCPVPSPLACRQRLTSSRARRSCGTGHSGGSGAPSGSASAAFLSMKRGRAFSPQRHRLIRPNRASPTKPTRSGIPASAGAIADFQVRGRISAVRVIACPQLRRQAPLLGHRQPAARQVPDDAGADAGHIIDQRGAQGGGQEIDGPVRPALLQHAHHGVAADEIADPHIGNDQDRPGVVRVLLGVVICLNLYSYL